MLVGNGTRWVIHLGGCILGLYPMQSQEWFMTPAGGCQLIPAAQPSCGESVACHPVCCLATHPAIHRHYTCKIHSRGHIPGCPGCHNLCKYGIKYTSRVLEVCSDHSRSLRATIWGNQDCMNFINCWRILGGCLVPQCRDKICY